MRRATRERHGHVRLGHADNDEALALGGGQRELRSKRVYEPKGAGGPSPRRRRVDPADSRHGGALVGHEQAVRYPLLQSAGVLRERVRVQAGRDQSAQQHRNARHVGRPPFPDRLPRFDARFQFSGQFNEAGARKKCAPPAARFAAARDGREIRGAAFEKFNARRAGRAAQRIAPGAPRAECHARPKHEQGARRANLVVALVREKRLHMSGRPLLVGMSFRAVRHAFYRLHVFRQDHL